MYRRPLVCLKRAFGVRPLGDGGSSVGGRRSRLSTSAVCRNLIAELEKSDENLKSSYDCVIIGAGHNGLTTAAYLQQAGLSVCVLEKRHTIGGAAVTEEIIPGFKFSRASYLLSLLRPQVVNDLDLKKYGLKLYFRDPSSYTPLLESSGSDSRPKSLTLGSNETENFNQIAKFSEKDAKAYAKYEHQLARIVSAIDPLLDEGPVHIPTWTEKGWSAKRQNWSSMKALMKTAKRMRSDVSLFYDLMTTPCARVMEKWFDSEPLKATLATDAVIGAMMSPEDVGSGYVLLHHVMGELEGRKGAWAYVEGGMGAVSLAMARCARDRGVHVFTNHGISKVDVGPDNTVRGVVTEDGTFISSKVVLSNATPDVTYTRLVEEKHLPEKFIREVNQIDYTSPVTKINLAVNKLPSFIADPTGRDDKPLPHHQTTVHLNCDHMSMIHDGYVDAVAGNFSRKPMIEMTIPSSVDPTISPPGQHVIQLFTQYTPYTLAGGREWTDQDRKEYAQTVFDDIERYAPGFNDSIVGVDILTPMDLERTFGLTGGNIFHGAVSLNQLYFHRPLPEYCDYRSPIKGLYMCGSGAHPGGGVMGSPGRLAARVALQDWKK